MSEISPEDISALIATFDDSSWTEMHLRFEDVELRLNKSTLNRRELPALDHAAQPPQASPPSVGPKAHIAPSTELRSEAVKLADSADGHILRAPNLGTFYRSPKPGAPPYIEIGQEVNADTDVCLIEVMKLFTPVKAGIAGTVVELLVADGDLVEFDQPIFVIRPTNS